MAKPFKKKTNESKEDTIQEDEDESDNRPDVMATESDSEMNTDSVTGDATETESELNRDSVLPKDYFEY